MTTHPYCRGESCGMQIQWVECITRAGKLSKMPLDIAESEVELTGITDDSAPRGVIEVPMDPGELKGKFVFITTGFVRAAVCGDHPPFFTSHHSSCPDAEQFRGKK